jgi:aminotransferase
MCAPTAAQHAAIAALEVGEPFVAAMRAEYDRRRQLMVRRLNEIGLLCFEPMGAFYCFPDVTTATGLSAEDFAQALLSEERVAVVPGEAFGPSGAGHVRACYATAYEDIEVATGRQVDEVGAGLTP